MSRFSAPSTKVDEALPLALPQDQTATARCPSRTKDSTRQTKQQQPAKCRDIQPQNGTCVLRKQSAETADPLSDEQVSQFKRNGYLVVQGVATPKEVETAQKEFFQALAADGCDVRVSSCLWHSMIVVNNLTVCNIFATSRH